MFNITKSLLSLCVLFIFRAHAQAGEKKGKADAIAPGSIQSRLSPFREKLAAAEGVGPEMEKAVERGLKWLVTMQSPDGSWQLNDPRLKNKSSTAHPVGGTSLALLPFLAGGYTHKPGKDNPYAKTVEKGLAFLLRKQDKTGAMNESMYSHAIAGIVLCESATLTREPKIKSAAGRLIKYLVGAQHEAGGWRYIPNQAGDTSVSSWVIQALTAAKEAGIPVPPVVFAKAGKFLNAVEDPVSHGYGYVGPNATLNMTAAGLLCRLHVHGWKERDARLRKAMAIIEKNPPNAKRMYYCYYATELLHHLGGDDWKSWNKGLTDELLRVQVPQGYWSSQGDSHSASGGDIMQTSLSLLTLQAYCRHARLNLTRP